MVLQCIPFKTCYSDSPLKLYLFGDASSQADGFVVYRVQNGKSQIFCKIKVTPMKTKTLPTMELLAVCSAFGALTTILTSDSNISMETICISVYAQVVLSWLLTENFIKNLDYWTYGPSWLVEEPEK